MSDFNSPLVSIIVPVYNVEPYLEACIDSVKKQTYRNIELILVDDGSTDNCPVLCDKAKAEDDSIIVLHKANGGLSSARNAGLDICTGKYVCFLDSDDTIHELFLEILVQTAEDKACSIVQCSQTSVLDDLQMTLKCDVYIYDRRTALKKLFSETGVSTSACSKLFLRKLWDKVRFPEGFIYEDYATIYKVIEKSENLGVINEYGYYYRVNNTSITKSAFSANRLKLFEVSEIVRKDIAENYPEFLQDTINRDTRYAISFFYEAAASGFMEKDILDKLVSMIKGNIMQYQKSQYNHKSKALGLLISVSSKAAYKVISRL